MYSIPRRRLPDPTLCYCVPNPDRPFARWCHLLSARSSHSSRLVRCLLKWRGPSSTSTPRALSARDEPTQSKYCHTPATLPLVCHPQCALERVQTVAMADSAEPCHLHTALRTAELSSLHTSIVGATFWIRMDHHLFKAERQMRKMVFARLIKLNDLADVKAAQPRCLS